MINPTEIDLFDLPWVPLNATAGFPAQPGIYFAIDLQDTVQYIGLSKDVRGRWKKHHRYKDLEAIGGVRIVYLFVEDSSLLRAIESALIARFNPPLNASLPDRYRRNEELEDESDLTGMRVVVDIYPYWKRDRFGNPQSISSVYEEIKGTSLEVGRNTLRLALEGKLDRGLFSNLVKLTRLCSLWSDKKLKIDDLFRIEDEGEE
jgi:hypothetical protein